MVYCFNGLGKNGLKKFKVKEDISISISVSSLIIKPTPSRILSPAIFYYYTDNKPAAICISTLNYGWCVGSQISLHVNYPLKKRLIYNSIKIFDTYL
jgi:hypothetical protein